MSVGIGQVGGMNTAQMMKADGAVLKELAQAYGDEAKARGASGIVALAQRAGMSALQQRWRKWDFETGGSGGKPTRRAPGRLFLWCLPPTIHGHRRNRAGAFPCAAFQVANGFVSPVLIQKIRQRQSDPPDGCRDL